MIISKSQGLIGKAPYCCFYWISGQVVLRAFPFVVGYFEKKLYFKFGYKNKELWS